MNPEIQQLQDRIAKLEQIINYFVSQDRYDFKRTIAHRGTLFGLYSTTPAKQPNNAGATGNMTSVGGAAVLETNGFKGYSNSGTAYTIGDIVGALKQIGALAP